MNSDAPDTGGSLTKGLYAKAPALAFAPFRRYWLGSAASVGATQFINVGQAWLMWELTESPLFLGYLGLAASLPNIALTLFGGVIADRFNKKRILIITSLLATLLMTLLATLDGTGAITPLLLLLITGSFSALTGLEWPTRSAFYPLLVPRPAFMSAVALNSFTWQATRTIMPLAAGAVITQFGTWLIFALATVGFGAMAAVMLSLHVTEALRTDHDHPIKALANGLGFIIRTPLFRYLMLLIFSGMFFVNSFTQMLPYFVTLMGRAESDFGLLVTAGGIGSVLGALLIGLAQQHRHLGLIMLASAAGAAIALFGFGAAALSQMFWLTFVISVIIAILIQVFMISTLSVMQLEVPDELRGRVMGFFTMCYSLVPLGGLMLGLIAEWSSGVLAISLSASVFLIILAGLALLDPTIRTIDGVRLAPPN